MSEFDDIEMPRPALAAALKCRRTALLVAAPPHVRSGKSVQRLMFVTCAALLPAAGCAVALYG